MEKRPLSISPPPNCWHTTHWCVWEGFLCSCQRGGEKLGKEKIGNGRMGGGAGRGECGKKEGGKKCFKKIKVISLLEWTVQCCWQTDEGWNCFFVQIIFFLLFTTHQYLLTPFLSSLRKISTKTSLLNSHHFVFKWPLFRTTFFQSFVTLNTLTDT